MECAFGESRSLWATAAPEKCWGRLTLGSLFVRRVCLAWVPFVFVAVVSTIVGLLRGVLLCQSLYLFFLAAISCPGPRL